MKNSALKRIILVLAAFAALTLFATSPAGATTFCVPDYSAACPNSGGNVKEPDLAEAVKDFGSDGVTDKVIMPAFAYTTPTTLSVGGSDDLEIVGAGPAATTLTSSAAQNLFVVNLSGGRDIIMRDLKVIVPATFPDAQGAGIYENDDSLINVDIETRNPGSTGVLTFGGALYRGVDLYGTGSGTFTNAIDLDGAAAGDLRIEQSLITDAATGIRADNRFNPITMTGTRISPLGFGLQLAFGADATVSNSVIERGTESPVSVTVNSAFDTDLDLSSSTIAATGTASKTAINVFVTGVDGNGSANVDVSDSILHGFTNTWYLSAPDNDPDVGDANLSIDHSDYNPVGQQPGDGTLIQGEGNINSDPAFKAPGDYHPLAGSPVIDAAATAGGPAEDLEGTARPQDGDGNGVAIGDMGAYEYKVPTVGPGPGPGPDPEPKPTCDTDPALCPKPPETGDTTAPVFGKVKFRAPAKRAGFLKLTLTEAAKAKITFKPVPAGKGKKKRKVVKLNRDLAAGANTVKLRRGLLKRGRYRLNVVATDAAGNSSAAAVRTVRIKKGS